MITSQESHGASPRCQSVQDPILWHCFCATVMDAQHKAAQTLYSEAETIAQRRQGEILDAGCAVNASGVYSR